MELNIFYKFNLWEYWKYKDSLSLLFFVIDPKNVKRTNNVLKNKGKKNNLTKAI